MLRNSQLKINGFSPFFFYFVSLCFVHRSETESSDSEIECIGSVSAPPIDITNDDEIQEFLDACEETAPPGPIKAKGEFTIDDLPPIDELTITVPESECVELGKVSGIVGTLGKFSLLWNFCDFLYRISF